VRVDEHTIQLGSSPVFYRSAPAPSLPPLYVHGVPTSCDEWTRFLARTGGIAPDLPGFGRSGKAGNLDYSLEGLVGFLERLLGVLEIERVKLVGHDWGATVGLVFALRHPTRVERLVIVNSVPLLEGFRWPWFAQLWRRPVIGELAMGSTTKWLFGRVLRQGSASPQAWPAERVAAVWEQFDQGTQRAILRLYRSSDVQQLAEAGAGLATLQVPVLVVWGEDDPWISPTFGDEYAKRLPQATLERVPDAGHWPWLDRPEVTERIAIYLEGEEVAAR
jgi:pimeloyl-ACP methyl ester carboxylesterase